jgi:hypothetical protein
MWNVKDILLFPLHYDEKGKIIFPAELGAGNAVQNTGTATTYNYYPATRGVTDEKPNGWETKEEY